MLQQMGYDSALKSSMYDTLRVFCSHCRALTRRRTALFDYQQAFVVSFGSEGVSQTDSQRMRVGMYTRCEG